MSDITPMPHIGNMSAYVEKYFNEDEIDEASFDQALERLENQAGDTCLYAGQPETDDVLRYMLKFVVAYGRRRYLHEAPSVTKRNLLYACDDVSQALHEVSQRIDELASFHLAIDRYGDIATRVFGGPMIGEAKSGTDAIAKKFADLRSLYDKRIRREHAKHQTPARDFVFVCTLLWRHAGGDVTRSKKDAFYQFLVDVCDAMMVPSRTRNERRQKEPLTAHQKQLDYAVELIEENPTLFDEKSSGAYLADLSSMALKMEGASTAAPIERAKKKQKNRSRTARKSTRSR